MPRVITERKDVDLKIALDAEALFAGTKAGHLSYIHYGEPEDKDDKVCGSREWIKLQNHPDYYLSREELELIPAVSRDLGRLALAPEVVDLGTGDEDNTRRKTLPLIKELCFHTYHAVDFSESFARQAAAVVRSELDVTARHHCFDFLQPPEGSEFPLSLLLMFGSTITNIPVSREDGYAQLKAQFAKLRRLLRSNGYLLVGFDTNQNEHELHKAYVNEPHARMSMDVLWRILRDTDVRLDPDDFEYRGHWMPEHFRYAQMLTVKRDCPVSSPRRSFSLKAGQLFNIANSFKFPVDVMADAAAGAGWRLTRVWTQSGRVHYGLFEAVSQW
jgi:uncharacterized SAM-dependent methyltransferase